MKLLFKATNIAPEYDISGETITATYNGQSEVIDLSEFPEGGQWEGGEPDSIELSSRQIIRDVERIDGTLHVTLCQKVPVSKITYFKDGKHITLTADTPAPEYDKKIEHRGGDWTESDWITNYQKDKLYIKQL